LIKYALVSQICLRNFRNPLNLVPMRQIAIGSSSYVFLKK
jgi:hypothetical protein